MRLVIIYLAAFCLLMHPRADESLLTTAPNIVNEYWELEGQGRELLQGFSDWLIDYRQNNQVITPILSENLSLLGEQFYILEARLGYLRQELSITVANHIQQYAFNEIYSLEEVQINYELEAFDALILAATDLIVFELISFIFNAARLEKILIKHLNELNINGTNQHFEKMANTWLASKRKKELARTLVFIDKQKDTLDTAYQAGAIYLTALRERIDTYLAGEIKKSCGLWQQIKDFFYRDFFSYKQQHSKMLNWMEYQLSKVFGNVSGTINWQKYLDRIAKEELKRLNDDVLQPGDLIIEKTKGAITDTFIPGHFGHVALYIGNTTQLKEMYLKNGSPFIDHPLVQKHLPLLQKGQTTAEAVRSGVRLENIENWIVSDLAVLRPVSYPKKYLADVLLKALSYVNTRYDFNFDINTSSIVTCSELPFQVYKGINFRTNRLLGRHTISPDDIAISGGAMGLNTPNRPLQLIYFNHQTKTLPPANMFVIYLSLLSKDSNYYDAPENNHNYDHISLLWEETTEPLQEETTAP